MSIARGHFMQHRLASDQDNDEPNRINTVITNIVK